MKRSVWWLGWLGVLALAGLFLPTRVQAAGHRDDAPPQQVVVGQDFVLEAGESVPGDLVVLGGRATLQPGSTVLGDVVVMGGSLEARGIIQGQAVVMGGRAVLDGTLGQDLVVMGGQIHLRDQARVQGDVVLVGGTLRRDPGAVVHGRVVRTFSWGRGTGSTFAPAGPGSGLAMLYQQVVRTAWAGLKAVVYAALAMLTALFAPQALQRTATAAERYPLHSAGAGFLAMVLAAVLAVVLTITLVGIPLVVVLALVMGLLYWLGLFSLGWLLGHRLVQALGRAWPLVAEAGLGTLLLVLLMAAVDVVACIGWALHLAVVLVAQGAAVLTVLGTRPAEATLEQVATSIQTPSTPPAPPAPTA